MAWNLTWMRMWNGVESDRREKKALFAKNLFMKKKPLIKHFRLLNLTSVHEIDAWSPQHIHMAQNKRKFYVRGQLYQSIDCLLELCLCNHFNCIRFYRKKERKSKFAETSNLPNRYNGLSMETDKCRCKIYRYDGWINGTQGEIHWHHFAHHLCSILSVFRWSVRQRVHDWIISTFVLFFLFVETIISMKMKR